MDFLDRLVARRALALTNETTLDEVMATLQLLESDRFDRHLLNNIWYFPLDGEWEERVMIWAEPVGAPTMLRVQHSLVASHKGTVEKGWIAGVKDVFAAWSKRVAAETKVKATKSGSSFHFERQGGRYWS